MPSALQAIDALCLPSMVDGHPVSFRFPVGGAIYSGTVGARDTTDELINGGVIKDERIRLLVAQSQFSEYTTLPDEGDKLEIYVDSFGIPTVYNEGTPSVKTLRVNRRVRAGAGITFDLISAAR